MPNGNIGAVNPTLFLGLGGTGKEILLRLRRRFFTRYGKPGLPCVAYLWLDTDIRDLTAQGEKMDEIYREVAFGTEERIALLEGDVGTYMTDVFQNKKAWQRITCWLYKEVEAAGRNISDGAGNVRAVGRLAYFFRYDVLQKRLYEVLGDQGLKKASVQQEMMEILPEAEFDPRTQVVVVASVAGGTGSGTLLDAAFTLSHIAKDVGLSRIVLLLAMPNVYFGPPGNEERPLRSYGNSYASLKELEFYCVRLDKMAEGAEDDRGLSSDFEVEWAKGSPQIVVGPPFHLAYLLEIRNEEGIGVERHDVFDMAAEVLYLDFLPGEFSRSKRSRLSNDVVSLSGHAGHNFELEGVALQQAFSRRWASFGMAKIEIPVDQIREACAAELARRIVKHWDRAMTETDVRGLVRDEAVAKQFDAEGLKQRFGPAWRDKIHAELERQFPPLPEAGPSGQAADPRADFVRGLGKKIRDFKKELAEFQASDPALLGIAISVVRNQAGPVIAKLREDLREWVSDCVDNSARGFNALIQDNGFLHLLTFQFQGLWKRAADTARTECDERAEKAAADEQAWDRRCFECLEELQGVLPSAGISGLAAKSWTARVVYRRIRDALEDSVLAATEREIWKQASEIARQATAFLERERAELTALQKQFGVWAMNYGQRRDHFLDPVPSRLYIRIFDRDKDWDLYYRLDWDEDTRQSQPVKVKSEETAFLSAFCKAPKAYKLKEAVRQQGADIVESELMAYAVKRFRDDFRAHPRQQNVLESPAFQSNPDQFIAHMVNNGLPMVKLETQLRGKPVNADASVFIGVADRNDPNCRSFAAKVQANLTGKGYGAGQIQVLTTERPWEVYLFIGKTAFPLPAVQLITSTCHKSYYDFYRNLRTSNIPLHFSRHVEGQLDDLLVYQDKDLERIKQALQILVFGRILRVVECTSGDRGDEYCYQRWVPPTPEYEALGPRRDAIERLRASDVLRQQLWEEVDNREKRLTDEQRFAFYWALSFLRLSRRYLKGTSEANLVRDKLAVLYTDLVNSRARVKITVSEDGRPVEKEVEVTKELLDISSEAVATRGLKIKEKFGIGIDWSTDIPMLALPPWVIGEQ